MIQADAATMDPCTASVLVLDDHELILSLFRRILAKPGLHVGRDGAAAAATLRIPRFQVETADRGPHAIEMVVDAQASGQPYDVAFVDVSLPSGPDGIETARAMWQADPELRIVFCSGVWQDSHLDRIAEFAPENRHRRLLKPFDSADVVRLAWELSSQRRAVEQAVQASAASSPDLLHQLLNTSG